MGVVDKSKIIDGSKIKAGDALIGIASNGLHSNGYSLARKVFFDVSEFNPGQYISELNATLGNELLKPTRIYVKAFNVLKEKMTVKGMAHITGGGIPGNLPRILRGGLTAKIYSNSWPVPPIFSLIKKLGNVPDDEMKKTFNMGIGYVIVVDKKESEVAIFYLKKSGFAAYNIGLIEKGGKKKIYYV